MAYQNAADSAAMAGAVWQARGLNVIAALNIVWIPAFIFDLVKLWFTGDVNFTCTTVVQKIQNVMEYAIPIMAITQVVTYGRANKADIAFPLPTAVAESLLNINTISDVEGIIADAKSGTSWIPCCLNVERQKYFPVPGTPVRWLGLMTGGEDVYTFSLAYKSSQSVLIGGSLLGIRIPSIYTTAKAVPYGGRLGGVELEKIFEDDDIKTSKKKDKDDKTKKDKDEGETETHLTTKVSFGAGLLPVPNYKAKFDKTGFDRILMVH